MLLDLDEECNVVGSSRMTSNASHGYRIADEFMKKGKKVVMGGIHPYIQHADVLTITIFVVYPIYMVKESSIYR
jgi:hypothetical protein